jgi:hypothetical protein
MLDGNSSVLVQYPWLKRLLSSTRFSVVKLISIDRMWWEL